MQGKVGGHDIAGGSGRLRPGELRDVRGYGGPRPQCGTRLAHGARDCSCGEERVRDMAQQIGIGGVGECLGFDLAEARGHAVTLHDRDAVVDDLDGRGPRAVEEHSRGPLALERGDRDEGRGAGECRDQAGEGGRHGIRKGLPHFVAHPLASTLHGQLEVPALIRAARTAAQGDAPAEEPQVRGVVVDVGHREGRSRLDAGDSGHRREVREREGTVDAELQLDFAMGGCHDPALGAVLTPGDRGCGAPR